MLTELHDFKGTWTQESSCRLTFLTGSVFDTYTLYIYIYIYITNKNKIYWSGFTYGMVYPIFLAYGRMGRMKKRKQ